MKAGELYDIAVNATALLDEAEARGLPREVLSEASGLPVAFDDPMGATVSYPVLAAALREAVARTGDEALGLHMGERSDPPKMGVLGYLTVNQPTLRDVLGLSYDLLARMSNTFAVRLELNEDPARLVLLPAQADVPMLHQLSEFHASVFVRNTRRYVSPHFRPRVVRFPHRAPVDTAEHRRIFRCPISFGAPALTVEFDAAWLDVAVPGADPTLTRTLEPFAQRELERLPNGDGITERLRAALAGRLGAGGLTLGTVAAQMGYRPRTLQYRLRQAGTSFQQVLDDVREEAARALLTDTRLPMEDVAARLGFSDTAAFYRAFRRWTGTTPQAVRERRPA